MKKIIITVTIIMALAGCRGTMVNPPVFAHVPGEAFNFKTQVKGYWGAVEMSGGAVIPVLFRGGLVYRYGGGDPVGVTTAAGFTFGMVAPYTWEFIFPEDSIDHDRLILFGGVRISDQAGAVTLPVILRALTGEEIKEVLDVLKGLKGFDINRLVNILRAAGGGW